MPRFRHSGEGLRSALDDSRFCASSLFFRSAVGEEVLVEQMQAFHDYDLVRRGGDAFSHVGGASHGS